MLLCGLQQGNKELRMSNPNAEFLVVDPGLSYVSFAQRISAAYLARVIKDCATEDYPIKVIPYSQLAEKLLLLQKKRFYSNKHHQAILPVNMLTSMQ